MKEDKRERYRCDDCGRICHAAKGRRAVSYGWCMTCVGMSRREVMESMRRENEELKELERMQEDGTTGSFIDE